MSKKCSNVTATRSFKRPKWDDTYTVNAIRRAKKERESKQKWHAARLKTHSPPPSTVVHYAGSPVPDTDSPKNVESMKENRNDAKSVCAVV